MLPPSMENQPIEDETNTPSENEKQVFHTLKTTKPHKPPAKLS